MILAVPALYVSRERTFYSYDVGGYHDTAGGLAHLCGKSLACTWRLITGSLANEYNMLYTIPLLPFLLLFGEARLQYVIALAVVYLLPFILALGALGARLFPDRPRRAFWGTVALALLTPAVWVPTLRGYPDTGAALLVALATLAYLRDTRLGRWWQAPLIGSLLGATVIYRRHFAYAAFTFLIALALLTLLGCLRQSRGAATARRVLAAASARVALAGLMSLATLVVFHPAFVKRVLTTDYYALHASYLHAPPAMLEWATAGYGVPTWGAAIAGLIWAMRRRVSRDAALFVGLSGGLALLVWVLIVRQVDPHYTLHFTPLVVLSLAACAHWLGHRRRGRAGILVRGALATWAAANLVFSLGFFPRTAAAALRPLFAAPSPPLTHGDPEVITELVAYLRAVTTTQTPIYVAAASVTLNRDLIDKAERALYGRDAERLLLLPVPEVDSVDFYPLPALLQARYVVVATPFQHHLPPEEQDVVRVVVDLFAADSEFARDFAPLPPRFTFADGTAITVYKRQRATPLPTAMRALRAMQAAIGERPGGQPDWLVLDRGIPAGVTWDEDNAPTVSAYPGPRDGSPATTLLHLTPQAPGATLTGRLTFRDAGCPGVALRFSRLGSDGGLIPLVEVERSPVLPDTFAVTLPAGGGGVVLFEIVHLASTQGHPPCTVTLTGLATRPAGAGADRGDGVSGPHRVDRWPTAGAPPLPRRRPAPPPLQDAAPLRLGLAPLRAGAQHP